MELRPSEKVSGRQTEPSTPQHIRRIVLTGFMGSGKTTIGSLLSKRLGWQFLDVDEQMEAIGGAPAQQLFANLGERGVREFECQVTALCLGRENAVVALGGAAIDLDANQTALANSKSTLLVFLDGEFEILMGRCLQQELTGRSTHRPLLHKREIALERFATRRALNSAQAHLRIDVSCRSCEDTVESIVEKLRLAQQSLPENG